MSNIIDAYCVYQCAEEIKRSTEATRKMLDQKAYIYQKRYSEVPNKQAWRLSCVFSLK